MRRRKFTVVVLGRGKLVTELLSRMMCHLPTNCKIVRPSSKTNDKFKKLVASADVILGSKVSKKVIESAKKLKMVQTLGAGVDDVDMDFATKRGVFVCNAGGFNAISVAEHAFLLMLALVRKLPKFQEKHKKKLWYKEISIELYGKTLGIVGLGKIGREVAKRARAFGMRVITIKRTSKKRLAAQLGIDFVGGPEDLHFILRESDFILLSVPLSSETRKMIGKKELSMMKKSAYLINVSRGGVVDEQALIQALKEKKIAGAGLDVFEIEPLNPDNPFLKLDNVILTPHIGGLTRESCKRRALFLAKNIKRVLCGEIPNNIVNTTLEHNHVKENPQHPES